MICSWSAMATSERSLPSLSFIIGNARCNAWVFDDTSLLPLPVPGSKRPHEGKTGIEALHWRASWSPISSVDCTKERIQKERKLSNTNGASLGFGHQILSCSPQPQQKQLAPVEGMPPPLQQTSPEPPKSGCSDIVAIYQLRSRRTCNQSELHMSAAGRSVAVAEMFNRSPAEVRDIWARKIHVEETRMWWTEHEFLLYACSKEKEDAQRESPKPTSAATTGTAKSGSKKSRCPQA